MISQLRLAGSDSAEALVPLRSSNADVTERLFLEFEPTYGLDLLSQLLRGCRAELGGVRASISSESLDGLVRLKLARLSVSAKSA